MKKKTPARPAAKKKAAPKKTRSRKLAAKPAAKKPRRAPAAKANPVAAKPMKPATPALPLSLPVHLPLHAAPDRPGLHLPMKPAPAYAQMIQRGLAGKPPPHKLTK